MGMKARSAKVQQIIGIQLDDAKRPFKLRPARRMFERAYVDYLMRLHNHDKRKVAKALGISYSSVKEKCRKGFGGRR